ncbi:MAG: hypothetical protein LBT16_13445, partial [Treponema sp.]|nr:hypothetical protein [Treponema sp.]
MAGSESTVPDYPRGITFEQVWAALMEDRKENDRRREENDRIIKNMREENDRRREENDRMIKNMREENDRRQEKDDRRREENDRIIKELSVQMGGLHRSFGELAEHLVAPGIASRFNEIGYHFDSLAPQGIEIYDESR